jgi:serine/threonine-protein kinase HipA
MLFNVLCGNTDDHARNHSAYWDGQELAITPAYDICPQGRSGGEASQSMLIVGDQRTSQIATCLEAAPLFLLSNDQASSITRHLIETIRDRWMAICVEAELSEVDRNSLWRRQFLNAYAFINAPTELAELLEPVRRISGA